jgi:hypothetical protein
MQFVLAEAVVEDLIQLLQVEAVQVDFQLVGLMP